MSDAMTRYIQGVFENYGGIGIPYRAVLDVAQKAYGFGFSDGMDMLEKIADRGDALRVNLHSEKECC